MSYLKGIFAIVIIFIFINIKIFAQEENYDTTAYNDEYYDEIDDEEYSGWLGNIAFDLKTPYGSMEDKFSSVMPGFSISLYKQLNKELPLFVGGGGYMNFYGHKSLTYYSVSPEDGYEYEYSESFTGDMFGFNAGAKYFLKRSFWRFNPYIGIDVHFRRAFGTINTTNLDLDETENTDFIGGNSGFGYELNIGSLIDINSDNMFLNISLAYDTGGGLFLYVEKEEEIQSEYVQDYFDYKYIAIGFLKIKFGIAFSQ